MSALWPLSLPGSRSRLKRTLTSARTKKETSTELVLALCFPLVTGAIEGLDQFLRKQVADVEVAQFHFAGPFEPLKAVIDRLLSHPELEALNKSFRSQLRMILGSNPENDDLIAQQKEFLGASASTFLRVHLLGACLV